MAEERSVLADLGRAVTQSGSVKLTVEHEHPEDRTVRLRRQERDAEFVRWTRVVMLGVLSLIALATGLTAFVSTDAARRDLAQKVAVPIVTGFVGFFLGRKDS